MIRITEINKKIMNLDLLEKSYIYYITIFIFIFFVTLWIKQGAILSSMLISDDLHYFSESIYGDLASRILYFCFYSWHNNYLGEPALVRLLYLMIFSLSGVFTWIVLNIFINNKIVSLIITLMAFMNPSTAIMITFINGSYSILYYFLFIIGVMFFCLFVFNYDQYESWFTKITFLLLFALSLSFATYFGSANTLMPLAVLFLPWWRTKLYNNYKKYLVFAVIPIAIVFVSRIFPRLYGYQSHYGADSVDFNVLSMANRGILFISSIITNYTQPHVGGGFHYPTEFNISHYLPLILLCGGVLILITPYILKKVNNHIVKKEALYLLPFLGISLLFSIGPHTTVIHLWKHYYYMPGLFLLMAIGIIIFVFPVWNKLAYVLSLAIIIISISSLINQQVHYDQGALEHERLINFVKEREGEWAYESQIMIRTDKIPYIAAFGGWGRDVGFIRLHTDRPDIQSAIIVPERRLVNYPFDDKDTLAHHSNVFSMNSPTYLYDFNYSTGDGFQIGHILVIEDFVADLYSASDEGINHVESGTYTNVEEMLSRNGLGIADCIVYNLGNTQNIPAIDVDDEDTIGFNGEQSQQHMVDILGHPSVIIFETILKSEDESQCLSADWDYSDTCPPMPFLAYPVALYQTSIDEFQFQFKIIDNGKEMNSYVSFMLEPGQWYKFVITFDLENESILLSVNDVPYEYVSNAKVKLDGIESITLGKGYNSRYWQGQMHYFIIYDSDNNYYLEIRP